MNWGECYYDHFEKYLKAPIHRLSDQQVGLQLIAYEGSSEVFFCTLGMTKYSQELGDFCELFVTTTYPSDDLGDLFLKISAYLVLHSVKLKLGLVLSGLENIDPNFVEHCHKTAIYFTFPFFLSEKFAVVSCGEQVGKVYQGIFITEAERNYIAEHGGETFEDIVEATANINFADLYRSSII